MAKKTKAERQAEMLENMKARQMDDLLGDPVVDDGPKDEIDDLLDGTPAKDITSPGSRTRTIKEPSVPRASKGIMVQFKTKNTGETITGLGVLYYVVRMDGKLHYKEASQVTKLPDDWKPGDPIPQKAVDDLL